MILIVLPVKVKNSSKIDNVLIIVVKVIMVLKIILVNLVVIDVLLV